MFGDRQQRVLGDQADLKLVDVVANPANGVQKFRVGGGVGGGHLIRGDLQSPGGQLHLVELFRVMEQGRHPLLSHVVADSLHHLDGGKRFAKDGLRQFFAGGRHHVRLFGKRIFQRGQLLGGLGGGSVNAPDLQRRHFEPSTGVHPSSQNGVRATGGDPCVLGMCRLLVKSPHYPHERTQYTDATDGLQACDLRELGGSRKLCGPAKVIQPGDPRQQGRPAPRGRGTVGRTLRRPCRRRFLRLADRKCQALW